MRDFKDTTWLGQQYFIHHHSIVLVLDNTENCLEDQRAQTLQQTNDYPSIYREVVKASSMYKFASTNDYHNTLKGLKPQRFLFDIWVVY